MTEVSKWSGIIPALVTPLTSAGAPDVRGLTRIIDYVVTRGVHGLSILGSTGEGALLPRRVQHEVLEATMTMNQTRPVLVGIPAAVPRDALEFARCAFENGADGVMMTPPFYYPLDQRGVSEFYTTLSVEKIQERRAEPAREDLERDEARRRGITSQLRGGLLVKAGRNRQPPDL